MLLHVRPELIVAPVVDKPHCDDCSTPLSKFAHPARCWYCGTIAFMLTHEFPSLEECAGVDTISIWVWDMLRTDTGDHPEPEKNAAWPCCGRRI